MILYRAGGVNLYLSEAFTWSSNGYDMTKAINIINTGSYYNPLTNREQLGVRGRVGLGTGPQRLRVENIVYFYNKFTNKYESFVRLPTVNAQQLYLENYIIDERARELAFEGERFYDLMRVAQRRNDPTFLASRVAEKYPAAMRDKIYNKLLDTKNWYINYFE